DMEALKNKHMYEGIDKNTDYVLFDDLDARFPFSKLFSDLTGDLPVNPKHGKQYLVPFEESPKFAVTSNFGLFKADSSTNRRILYTVYSDYYHYKSDEDATEHNPAKDMGKVLFTQFNEQEWNDFFNFSAEALKFYIGENNKINPPMGNVEKRNALQDMGDGFKAWADSYFTEFKLNDFVVKTDANIDFEQKSKLKNWTSQRFKRALQKWCKYYGYEMNPQEVLNTQGRCTQNIQGTTKECIYIKTSAMEQMQQRIKQAEQDGDFDPTDDLAF
ncbi:MAG: hypothetical protein WCD31_09745, partial [Gillisia sp.]